MSVSVPSDAPKPRQCHVKKWEDFNGYGFNLHAEKGKHGHHIGALDPGSPAEAAGIKEGDRIVEVNGTNIANENHQQVVSRIRAVANEVKLLVVDSATDDYYRERKIVVRGDMAGVVNITTPASKAVYDADPMAGYAAAAAATTDEAEPQPRLAKLRTWPDFQGYGFNLTTEKNKPGQYIGKVDSESPASTAGVREGDRIIEVNGVNVTEETHHQVVNRIKARPGQVDLLLADKPTDLYYAGLGTVIRGDMPQVHTQETPESSKAPRPRLFHLLKWPDFQGYGFDLHEEKTRPGHLIGSVDPGSPSAFVRMRRDDKIIEVNGHNVLEESHKRVVERITENEGFVKLLVVDSVAEQYYNDNSIWVHGRMDNIDIVECPAQMPSAEPAVTTSNSTNVHAAMDTIDHASSVIGIADVKPKPSQHAPRLCHLQLSPEFPGYGFDLQNEKDREGHFVGGIEESSPAGRSALREGDRLVEANGVNVENTDHPDVVELIKNAGGSLKLLVVDDQAWHYFVNNNIKVQEDLVQGGEEVVHVNGAAASAVENGYHSTSSRSSSVGVSRLCHLQSNPASPGYGFELHRLEKTKGHFIGPIDSGSPAETAGLHKGDEIVEINGTNIQKKSHNEVVFNLKEYPERVTLLVTNKSPLAASVTTGLTNGAQLRHHTPHARHCHLKKWSDFDGYGFDLYEIRKNLGPRIGNIAKGSPAEATGFKQDDYIIEVNGENVEKLRHPEMVTKIGGSTQVKMLLVDQDAHTYFKMKSVRMHSDMENVENIHCPDNRNVVAVTSGPRRVQLETTPGFSGFGFDLQELTNKPGHYVGGVDPGSPAAAAGLERDDQIVEVNDQAIVKDSHDEVVNKIRQSSGAVALMVVSAGSSTVYHSNALWVDTGNRDTVIMVPTGEQSHTADVVDNSNTVISETAPRPRLCKLQRWADYSGYGFDLHEEKNHAGHLIGSVDPGSPADTAGLRVKDQIVEVNAHNVLESSHHEVVEHIKQHEDHVDMLVLDNNAKDYYDDNSIWVHSKMNNVHVIECPRRSSQAAEIPIPIPVPELSTVAANGAEPALRLCVLKRWSDYQGYGFNLHDEKGIAGHFIGSVDAGSPADEAGLKADDKLIEVNGEPVFDDDHHGVVRRVTSKPDGVELLVMDQSGDEYFRTQNVKPHGGMSNITVITCPPQKDPAAGVVHTNGVAEVKVDEIEVAEHNGHAYIAPEREPAREPSPVAVRAPTPEPVRAPTPEPVRVPTPEPIRAPTPEPIVEAPRVPTPEPVHHREPSPPPQQVNEVVKTVVVTTVMSEMRNGTEIKPQVEKTTEIEVENHDWKMKAESSTIVVPAHVDTTPVGVTSNEHHQHSTVEVSETHTNHFPAAVASTSQTHTVERVIQSDTTITEVMPVPPPPREEHRSQAPEERLVAYPSVMEHVVVAEPLVRHDAEMVHHARPASATYSRVEVVEVGASQPETAAVPMRAEHVSVMSSSSMIDGMGVRQSAPPGSMVVAGREETVRSEVPAMVTTTSTSTTVTERSVQENVATDDGFVITTPLYAEVKREPTTTVNNNWEDARERMVEAHSEPVELKSTTTIEGTFVTIGPSSTSEIRRSETEDSLSGSRDLRGSEVVVSPAVKEEEQGIVLLDYRTHLVESVTSKLPEYEQMSHHEDHGAITMTEEIDTSGIHIVPPPPPLPEEMSGSHTYTRETEVTYVESSVPQEDIGEPVSDHTSLITTAGVVSVAADRLSISSVATSEASSTAAAGYNFQESEITTETSEIAQESHHTIESSMNGLSEVVIVTSERSEPEEPLYQNVEAIGGNYTSVVAVAAEPVHVSAEPVEVVESHHHHDDDYETSTTTTTTEVVTLTSRTVRDSGHFNDTPEEIQAAPPPTEFTDVQNGSSRRSSTSTMSDSATQYAFTTETEDMNEGVEVSEFMSSSAEPTVIRTTSTTSSSYSYQKPVYEPEPYRNSQPAPAQGDALGGSSLQEALSRVKSRKKPKAGTGNLSMKEKFELFQQL